MGIHLRFHYLLLPPCFLFLVKPSSKSVDLIRTITARGQLKPAQSRSGERGRGGLGGGRLEGFLGLLWLCRGMDESRGSQPHVLLPDVVFWGARPQEDGSDLRSVLMAVSCQGTRRPHVLVTPLCHTGSH